MNKINQVHIGTGDNVAGDKINNKILAKDKSSIPVWAQWIAWIVAILALMLPLYIYIYPR